MLHTMPVAAISELNSKAITALNSTPEDMGYRTRYYNCWGFTAMLVGWSADARWLSDSDMEFYLDNNSAKVDNPTIGDIAVFRGPYGGLTHTAVLISDGPETLIHKPGGAPLEVISMATCRIKYRGYYGDVAEYRRPNRDYMIIPVPAQKEECNEGLVMRDFGAGFGFFGTRRDYSGSMAAHLEHVMALLEDLTLMVGDDFGRRDTYQVEEISFHGRSFERRQARSDCSRKHVPTYKAKKTPRVYPGQMTVKQQQASHARLSQQTLRTQQRQYCH